MEKLSLSFEFFLRISAGMENGIDMHFEFNDFINQDIRKSGKYNLPKPSGNFAMYFRVLF